MPFLIILLTILLLDTFPALVLAVSKAGDFELTSNIAIVTNYVSRGVTNSDMNPASRAVLM